MTDPVDVDQLVAENARLKKINQALMDRAERSTSTQGSDFSVFQSSIMLDDQVRLRTAELAAAVRENERITRALGESEAKFRSVVNQSLVGVVLTEAGRVTYTNPRFDEIFGRTSDEIGQMTFADLVLPADRSALAATKSQRLSGIGDRAEHRFRGQHKDGTIVDVECHSSAIERDGSLVLSHLILDITERAQAERQVQFLQERLREESIRDPLTGLYNRRYLQESIDRELTLAARHRYPVSVIICDLDHFKSVNDTGGHGAGDEVLRVAAELMRGCARSSDIVCRYGGEEFLLVLPTMAPGVAFQRAEQLRHTLETTIVDYEGMPFQLSGSFGVATYPDDGFTSDELIKAADTALYAAKSGGRNCVIACV